MTRGTRLSRVIRLAPAVLLGAAILAGGSPSLAAQELRVLPVDEAAQDPGFFAFRARLQRAIAERDTTALLAVVDPHIKLSFGGDYGAARLQEMLADPTERVCYRAIFMRRGGRWRMTIFIAGD